MRTSRVWIVLLVMLLASSGPVGLSQSLKELNQSLEEARQAREANAQRVKQLESQLAQLTGQEAVLSGQVGKLNSNIGALEAERRKVQGQRDDTQTKLKETEARLAELGGAIADQKKDVQDLMVLLDRDRSARYVKLLARAENIYDLLVKYRDIGQVGKQDTGIIDALSANIREQELKKLEYNGLVATLNEYDRELAVKADQLKQSRLELRGRIGALQKTQAGARALRDQAVVAQSRASSQVRSILGQIVAERKRIQEEARRRAEEERKRRAEEAARIRAIQDQQERDRQARLERQRQAREDAATARSNVILPRNVGSFYFPVESGSISEEFDGDSIVIRAPTEYAAVHAAAAGQVVRSEFVSANSGFTVIIRHTEDDLFTVYQNLQENGLVGLGARVARGQVIGYMGGGFLYPTDSMRFQVAIGDQPINPRQYLR